MRGARGGGQRSGPPLSPENHKNIGLLSNTGPDPLKNHKATKPAFNVGPSLDDGPLLISAIWHWWALILVLLKTLSEMDLL